MDVKYLNNRPFLVQYRGTFLVWGSENACQLPYFIIRLAFAPARRHFFLFREKRLEYLVFRGWLSAKNVSGNIPHFDRLYSFSCRNSSSLTAFFPRFSWKCLKSRHLPQVQRSQCALGLTFNCLSPLVPHQKEPWLFLAFFLFFPSLFFPFSPFLIFTKKDVFLTTLTFLAFML